jgi:hypothetical protein
MPHRNDERLTFLRRGRYHLQRPPTHPVSPILPGHARARGRSGFLYQLAGLLTVPPAGSCSVAGNCNAAITAVESGRYRLATRPRTALIDRCDGSPGLIDVALTLCP